MSQSHTGLLLVPPMEDPTPEREMVSLEIFRQRLENHMGEPLPEEFCWENIVLAGGWVGGAATDAVGYTANPGDVASLYDPEQYQKSDLDFFIYGLTDTGYHETLAQIFTMFAPLPDTKISLNPVSTVVSIKREEGCELQFIVSRGSASAMDVISQFDLAHCMVGYDGEQLFHTKQHQTFLETGISDVCTPRTLPSRVHKSLARGITVAVPDDTLLGRNTNNYINLDDDDEEAVVQQTFREAWEDPSYDEKQCQYYSVRRNTSPGRLWRSTFDGREGTWNPSPRARTDYCVSWAKYYSDIINPYNRAWDSELPPTIPPVVDTNVTGVCIMCHGVPVYPTLDTVGKIRCLSCCVTVDHVCYVSHDRSGGYGFLHDTISRIPIQIEGGQITTFGEWKRDKYYFNF